MSEKPASGYPFFHTIGAEMLLELSRHRFSLEEVFVRVTSEDPIVERET